MGQRHKNFLDPFIFDLKINIKPSTLFSPNHILSSKTTEPNRTNPLHIPKWLLPCLLPVLLLKLLAPSTKAALLCKAVQSVQSGGFLDKVRDTNRALQSRDNGLEFGSYLVALWLLSLRCDGARGGKVQLGVSRGYVI